MKRGSVTIILFVLMMLAAIIGLGMTAKAYYSIKKYNDMAEDFGLLLKYIEKSDRTESQIISNVTQAVVENGFRGLEVNLNYSKEHAGHHCMMYFPKTRSITIYCNYTRPTRLIKDLEHEYSHDLWFHVFSDEDRAEYLRIYQNATLFPSYYSIEKGYKEDFADSYAIYKTGGDIPADRRAFIEKMRKKYHEAK